jgi:hypothetical protein
MYARVLPLPVAAIRRRFSPSLADNAELCCIGVGVTYPFDESIFANCG